MKIRKIWAIFCITGIMLTTFFSVYIPLMFFDAWFADYMVSYGIDVLSTIFVFCIVLFGFLWISLTISFKIVSEFIKIYEWDKTIQN